MNRLQLYITKSNGAKSVKLTDINGSADTERQLKDISAIVEKIDYQQSSKSIFYIIDYVQGGYFIHIVRTIPPQRPTHLDAALFVSRDIDIMADELHDIVSQISHIVSSSAISEEDMALINRLLEREYDGVDKPLKVKPSHGEDLGYIVYGKSVNLSLEQVFDNGLYDSQWSDMNAIAVIPTSLGILDENAVDLYLEPEEQGEEESYEFVLPLELPDGQTTTLEFDLLSTKPMRRSPVKGYRIVSNSAEEGGQIELAYGAEWRQRAKMWLYGVAGVAIGIVIGLIISIL